MTLEPPMGLLLLAKSHSYIYTQKQLVHKNIENDDNHHMIYCTHCTKYWLGFDECEPQDIMLEEELAEGSLDMNMEEGNIE